jgi:hypothetical protein
MTRTIRLLACAFKEKPRKCARHYGVFYTMA